MTKSKNQVDTEPEETIEMAGPEIDLDDSPIEVSQQEVKGTIRSYVIAAMGLGLVPVPVLDIIAIVGVQLKLVHSLSKTYGVKYTENIAKTMILSLIGGILPTAVGGSLASLVKMVPGLGSFAGAAGVSILAGSLTYAVGKVFSAHFESGGTLLDFSPSKMRSQFKEQFKKGKDFAAETEDEAKVEAEVKKEEATA